MKQFLVYSSLIFLLFACGEKKEPKRSGTLMLTAIEVRVLSNVTSKHTNVRLETMLNGVPLRFSNDNGYHYKKYDLRENQVIILPKLMVDFEMYDNTIYYYPHNVNLDKYLIEKTY